MDFQEELILKGNIYNSRFIANRVSDKRIVSGCDHYSGDREENLFWWEGQGRIITNTERSEERIFLFKTQEFYKGSVIKTLEEGLILFDITKNPKGWKPKIIDYPSLLDISLTLMYYNAIPKGKEIIPTITPPILNFNNMVQIGFVADEKDQINLNLIN